LGYLPPNPTSENWKEKAFISLENWDWEGKKTTNDK
jgi:hypothetical protein